MEMAVKWMYSVDGDLAMPYDDRLICLMNNEDFENDAKDAGELGSGQQLVVCYEIKTVDTEADIKDLASLSVRYKNPGELEALQNDYTITRDVVKIAPSEDMKFASAVIMTSMIIHRSEYLDEGIDIAFVCDELAGLDISDSYKKEFKQLVAKIAEG